MMKEPEMFPRSVPNEKVSPTVLAIHPENHHRAKLPSPPPIKIQSAFHIIPTPPHGAALAGVISTETLQAVFPERVRGKANPIASRRMAAVKLSSNTQCVAIPH